MKLPIAVEASVADELRTWLALELERLDASSTNQFAHHVVTILLHEDLDIEDEPLSSGDDYFSDILCIKQTKTREKRKKAAVQFLRSAICCDETAGAYIQMVVDKLMQKIDVTKGKSRKASKRSILSSLVVNVRSPVKKTGIRNWAVADQQRYNEAFPSLCGDTSSIQERHRTANAATSALSWNKVPHLGKDGQKKKIRRRIGSRCTLLFRSAAEASACDIARETTALVLEDGNFSAAEAMEVWAPSHLGLQPLTEPPMMFCWKSAFSCTSLVTKPFSPSTAPLQLSKPVKCGYPSHQILPVILGDRACKTHPDCPHMDALSHWEEMGFLPVSGLARLQAREQRKRRFKIPPYFEDEDSEVGFYVDPSDVSKSDSKDSLMDLEDYDKLGTANQVGEVEGAMAFPSHHGTYWQDLINQGVVSLYPSFESIDLVSDEDKGCGFLSVTNWSPYVSLDRKNFVEKDLESGFRDDDDDSDDEYFEREQKKLKQDISYEISQENEGHPNLYINYQTYDGQDYKFDFGLSFVFDTEEDDSENKSRGSIVEDTLTSKMENMIWTEEPHAEQQLDHVKNVSQEPFCYGAEAEPDNATDDTAGEWDSPWCSTEWDDINQEILANIMGNKPDTPNPYLPPRLASCVTSEHSQFLQSAFVNAFFSSGQSDGDMQAWKSSRGTDQLTHIWQYINEHHLRETNVLPMELVKGSTCSNWLENNCKLGLLCPFSHPSI